MVIPPEVVVKSKDGMLFVYRPECVGPILDSDPTHAAEFAQQRAMDFVRAFGWDDVRFELKMIE